MMLGLERLRAFPWEGAGSVIRAVTDLEVGIQEACTLLFLIPLNPYYLNVLFDFEIITIMYISK